MIIDASKTLYAPTVLADLLPDMTSWEEEVFGPVASICKAHSVDHAIALANHSEFGLSAVVVGDDIDHCKTVANQLE